MKKSFFTYHETVVPWTAFLFVTLLVPLGSFSQSTSSFGQKKADHIPENGFWQVITRDAEPRTVTVQFYDLAKHLIYEERLTDVTFDLNKKKIRRALNGILRETLIAWDQHRRPMNLALYRAIR